MQTTATRKTVMLSLDVIVRFDMTAILAAEDRKDAALLAEHLLARLEKHNAPQRYYERALLGSLLKRKELEKRMSLLMYDDMIINIVIRFAEHARKAVREEVLTIAGYFESYRLLKDATAKLRDGHMTQSEFLALGKSYHPGSTNLDDTAWKIIRDAKKQHGEKFGTKMQEVIEKRYKDWNDLPDL